MITEMMVAIKGPIDTRPTWVGSKKYGGPPKTKLDTVERMTSQTVVRPYVNSAKMIAGESENGKGRQNTSKRPAEFR